MRKPSRSRPSRIPDDAGATAAAVAANASPIVDDLSSPPPSAKARLWVGLAVASLLLIHLAMAERSLVQENPTVDEVVHLPAGITYWQKRTFRLYHHNPPLLRMAAALPVVLSNPEMDPVYQQKSWSEADPSPTTFSQTFARVNTDRYFELFRLGRMVMPLFSVVGGLVVFFWSKQLYGSLGGLLSLILWCFCPNILAHTRLITTDIGSTAIGAGATFAFWLYLKSPSLGRAAIAGILLGLAQLTKFSMLLLYGVWPFLWLIQILFSTPRPPLARTALRGLAHGGLIVMLSVFVIDCGYLFEGVGTPLGKFEFASTTLTRPVPNLIRDIPATRNPLYAELWPFRENRFRGTFLANLPSPLPSHYLLGFDEQKVEADGIPLRVHRAYDALRQGNLDLARQEIASTDDATAGYPVYLNGELRRTGWWYYYLLTLVYKIPEGTWLILLGSIALLVVQHRSATAWADEVSVWTVPLIVLFSMSFLTDINLGLRYVISIFPYLFIAAGKVVPWVEGLVEKKRLIGRACLVGCLGLTIAATTWIHPSYLAYFNWASGGPDREPPRLIDSNLDWGQDLVGLRQWWLEHGEGKPIGLAYFGQINPTIFALRNEPFDWFLPPLKKGTYQLMSDDLKKLPLIGPAPRLKPGYYAVSASLVQGLSWRLYDSSPYVAAPAWNAFSEDALAYFRLLNASIVARIGHSILIYKLTEDDVKRATAFLEAPEAELPRAAGN